ncbi:MAG: hypothetical protein ACOY3Y_10745, partial [Acidobacteriota bacterium]
GAFLRRLQLPRTGETGRDRVLRGVAHRDGQVLYAVDEGEGSRPILEVYDLATDAVRRVEPPYFSHIYDLFWLGDRVVFEDGAHVHVLDIETGWTRQLSTDWASLLDSDRLDRVLFHQNGLLSADVFLYAVSTDDVTNVTSDTLYQGAASINGQHVAYGLAHNCPDRTPWDGCSNFDVLVRDLSTSSDQSLTDTPDRVEAGPSIRGDLVAYFTVGDGLYVHNLARGTTVRLAARTQATTSPAEANVHDLQLGGHAVYYTLRVYPLDTSASNTMLRYDLDCHCRARPDACPL